MNNLENELLWARQDLIDQRLKHKIESDALMVVVAIQGAAIVGLSCWVWWFLL
jgi:hypothetical protein